MHLKTQNGEKILTISDQLPLSYINGRVFGLYEDNKITIIPEFSDLIEEETQRYQNIFDKIGDGIWIYSTFCDLNVTSVLSIKNTSLMTACQDTILYLIKAGARSKDMYHMDIFHRKNDKLYPADNRFKEMHHYRISDLTSEKKADDKFVSMPTNLHE